jgi:hypothetical protein
MSAPTIATLFIGLANISAASMLAATVLIFLLCRRAQSIARTLFQNLEFLYAIGLQGPHVVNLMA